MSQSALPTIAPKTRDDYRAAVVEMFAEMDRIEERMLERDRSSLELRRETEAIKASTDKKLAELDELMARLSKAS